MIWFRIFRNLECGGGKARSMVLFSRSFVSARLGAHDPRLRPAPSTKLNASEYLVRKKCQGCGKSMDNQCKISKKKLRRNWHGFGHFGRITHFNLPIAGEDLPIAGKGTSLSRCQGCRPCGSNGTEIVNPNFGCSASKLSRRRKTKNSRQKKAEEKGK